MNDWLNLVVFLEKKMQSGNCSIQIGRILLDQQSWSDAARALNNGIMKGNLEDPDEASALLEKCNAMMGGSGEVEGCWSKSLNVAGNRIYE